MKNAIKNRAYHGVNSHWALIALIVFVLVLMDQVE